MVLMVLMLMFPLLTEAQQVLKRTKISNNEVEIELKGRTARYTREQVNESITALQHKIDEWKACLPVMDKE